MKVAYGALLTLSALLLASSANAAAFVYGDNLAHSCYTSAERLIDARNGIDMCTRALSIAMTPKDKASTLVNRGILAASIGNVSGALSDYDAALKVDATLGEAYVNRAATMIAMKRYGEAEGDASRAIELGAKRVQVAYYNRAVADEQLGKTQNAYEDYQAALKVEPTFAPAAEQLERFKVVQSP